MPLAFVSGDYTGGALLNTMKLLIGETFYINSNDKNHVFVQDGDRIASIEAVTRLRAACEAHLDTFTQSEIDRENDWQSSVRAEKNKKEMAAVDINQSDGFIYLMRNKRNGLTKIGYSKTPKHRESTLQSQEPEIEMIHSVKGTFSEEKAIHKNYAAARVRGEWFKLSETEIDEIKGFLV